MRSNLHCDLVSAKTRDSSRQIWASLEILFKILWARIEKQELGWTHKQKKNIEQGVARKKKIKKESKEKKVFC